MSGATSILPGPTAQLAVALHGATAPPQADLEEPPVDPYAPTAPAGTTTSLRELRLRLRALPASRPRQLHLDREPTPAVSTWAAVARASADSVLVLGADLRVVALSDAAARLLGVGRADELVGVLVDDLLRVVDFGARAVDDPAGAAGTPLLHAFRTGRMARGLLRVRLPVGELLTVDVSAVAVHDHASDHPAAVVAFFAEV